MNKLTKKVIAGVLAITLSCSAQAAWMCRAQSNVAWGEGYAFTKWDAQRIALHQCSINTPRNLSCWISSCWWQ